MDRSCSVKLVSFGQLRALVNVHIGEMEIRGFKVIDSDSSAWVAPPSREVTRNGKKEYFDIVRFQTPEAKQEFSAWILNEYESARKEA